MQNLMRRVLHGTRRKGRSVHRRSRAVRTCGVHLVRIAPVRLAHQNLLFKGQNLACCVPRGSSHRQLRVGRLTRGVHLWNAADEVPQPTQTRVLMRKARDADVYWSTLGIAHGAGLATSPVENAAHQVPQLTSGRWG